VEEQRKEGSGRQVMRMKAGLYVAARFKDVTI